MLSYPSAMTVSSRALTRWPTRCADTATSGRPAGASCPPAARPCWWWPTCARARPTRDLACGFKVGTSTVYRYVREAIGLLAAMAPTLDQAIEVARRKAFVILDGTLLRIDRVAMASGRDRAFYSGKHKCHGVNVQVIADPAGRLVWISPALPGARHDMGAAREHGIIDALADAEIHAVADTAYQGAGPSGGRAAAASPPGPGHRPLPATVGGAEAGQRRARPPTRPG